MKELPHTKIARAVISSTMDGETWEFVEPAQVPSWLKDESVMGDMLSGAIVFQDEDGPFYTARAVH